jgi:hypothetical protein
VAGRGARQCCSRGVRVTALRRGRAVLTLPSSAVRQPDRPVQGQRGALGRPPASEGRGEVARRAAEGVRDGGGSVLVVSYVVCSRSRVHDGARGGVCGCALLVKSTRDGGRSGLGSPIGCGAVVGAAQRCRR